MKKIIPKISSRLYFITIFMLTTIAINVNLVAAKGVLDTAALRPKILSVTNPNASYGIQIGDQLVRRVTIEVPLSLQLSKNDMPKKGKKDNGIELTNIDVATDTQKNHTLYTVNLSYQTFSNSATPVVMQLPAEKFRLTSTGKLGNKSQTLDLPAWGFWFSPLVTGGIETAQTNIQPDAQPPLVNLRNNQSLLIVFLTLLFGSLFAFVYINADGQWLPFTGGAFAKAHRKIKRLSKKPINKTAKEEKQALVYIHEAFNQHYGANIFARDIEQFIVLRPTFKKMKADIERFFDYSNQSLYAIEINNSAKVIENLLHLSKQLRHCERGI